MIYKINIIIHLVSPIRSSALRLLGSKAVYSLVKGGRNLGVVQISRRRELSRKEEEFIWFILLVGYDTRVRLSWKI